MPQPPDRKRCRDVGRGGADPASQPGRDAVFERLLASVDLERLPPPPSNGPEWRERVLAIERRMPGLSAFAADAPIGWFPVLEHAATLMPSLLQQGERFITRQVKEKFATLRWYSHIELASGEWDGGHPALGVVGWAEHVSEKVCSLHGTADGTLDSSDVWLLTLSSRAQLERQGLGADFTRRLYPPWRYA